MLFGYRFSCLAILYLVVEVYKHITQEICIKQHPVVVCRCRCVEFVVGSKNGHILLDPRSVEIDKRAGRWRLEINFGSIKNSRLYTIIYIIDISEAIILISYIYSGHFVLFLLLFPSRWWWWGAAAVAHQNRCPFFWGCRGTRWQHCPSFIIII